VTQTDAECDGPTPQHRGIVANEVDDDGSHAGMPRNAASIPARDDEQSAAHAAAGNHLIHEEFRKTKPQVDGAVLKMPARTMIRCQIPGIPLYSTHLEQGAEEQPGELSVEPQAARTPAPRSDVLRTSDGHQIAAKEPGKSQRARPSSSGRSYSLCAPWPNKCYKLEVPQVYRARSTANEGGYPDETLTRAREACDRSSPGSRFIRRLCGSHLLLYGIILPNLCSA